MNTPFFVRTEKIDTIIRNGPRTCSFDQDVRILFEEESAVQYFYTRISDPAWLPVLESAGEFFSPPEPETDAEGKLVRYPPWPQGEYLKRMASIIPEQVCAVLVKIPFTINYFVQKQIVEAACAIPPNVAVTLASAILNWIDRTDYLRFADDYAALINHFARGGEVQAAFSIAKALLKIIPASHKGSREDEPSSKWDKLFYKRILEKVAPVLSQTTGMESLHFFIALLKDATEFVHGSDENDRYYVWPSAIEDHEQNRYHDTPKDLLVFAVRDVGEAVINQFGKEVLEAIETQPFSIFKRIGLHLRRIYPDIDLEGTEALLRNPVIYQNPAFHHELFHLLRTIFLDLSQETKGVFFAHVKQGIKVDIFKENFQRWHQREATAEEIGLAERRHEFDKLIPVKEYLVGKWGAKWKELSKEFSIGEHPDFLSYIGPATFEPDEIPEEQDKLSAMSVQNLTSYLREYAKSCATKDDSLEGLGFQVRQLVKSDPEKYIAAADQFRGLSPEIVQDFVSAVCALVKDGGKFSTDFWSPVLRLCKWVVAQPRDEKLRHGRYADRDPGWGWTRKEIAQLLEEGLKSKAQPIPFRLRKSVWAIIKPLTNDPEPDQEGDSEGLRPLDLSINTVRGWAMHAVVQYALWIRRRNDQQPKAKAQAAQGFDVMPEVCEILNNHLNPDSDPSVAIRAVYGQYFPWLVLLDAKWAERAREYIFPKSADLQHLFDAAWETYIAFCRPYNNVLPVLKEEYAFAVQKIGSWSDARNHFSDPDRCLVNHLLTFYWRGLIELDDTLITGLYERASDELREHALSFVGENLHESIVKGKTERLKALWEYRLLEGKKLGPSKSCRKELSAFGAWFASRVFDDEWSLQQLEDMLMLASWAEPDNIVLERLAELSKAFPNQTVHCLSLMVEGDKEGWHISEWKDSMRTILSNAITCSDSETRQAATNLVHRLGSLGHLEFRDLIST